MPYGVGPWTTRRTSHTPDVSDADEVTVDGRRVPMKGDTIWVQPNSSHMHVFDAESGTRLSH